MQHYIDPKFIFNNEWPTKASIINKRKELLLEFDLRHLDTIILADKEYDKNAISNYFDDLLINIEYYEILGKNEQLNNLVNNDKLISNINFVARNDAFGLWIKAALGESIIKKIKENYFAGALDRYEIKEVFFIRSMFSQAEDQSYFFEIKEKINSFIEDDISLKHAKYNELNIHNFSNLVYSLDADFSKSKQSVILGVVEEEYLLNKYYNTIDNITEKIYNAVQRRIEWIPEASLNCMIMFQELLVVQRPSMGRNNNLDLLYKQNSKIQPKHYKYFAFLLILPFVLFMKCSFSKENMRYSAFRQEKTHFDKVNSTLTVEYIQFSDSLNPEILKNDLPHFMSKFPNIDSFYIVQKIEWITKIGRMIYPEMHYLVKRNPSEILDYSYNLLPRVKEYLNAEHVLSSNFSNPLYLSGVVDNIEKSLPFTLHNDATDKKKYNLSIGGKDYRYNANEKVSIPIQFIKKDTSFRDYLENAKSLINDFFALDGCKMVNGKGKLLVNNNSMIFSKDTVYLQASVGMNPKEFIVKAVGKHSNYLFHYSMTSEPKLLYVTNEKVNVIPFNAIDLRLINLNDRNGN